jgi:hypothetical protein
MDRFHVLCEVGNKSFLYWRGGFIFQGLKKIHTRTHRHDYNLSVSSHIIYISYYKSILNVGSEKQDTTNCAD